MRVDMQFALERAVKVAEAPGATACVGTAGTRLFTGATGWRLLGDAPEPATVDTIYDLASLTKVIATTTAVMLLHEQGRLALDAPLATWIDAPAFRAITPRHLLTHTSGLPAGRPLHREAANPRAAVARIAETPLSRPPGQRRVYSDLGFILLGALVEAVTGERLDAFCRRRIFAPLNMQRTTFNPHPLLWPQCAATEQCAWRGRLMRGEVHDENAHAIGGVSGHAGLFAPVEDVALFCEGLLEGRILARATLEEMLRMDHVPAYPWQGLGWKVDPWRDGSEGYLPARRAFGHTGWTGTSMWVDFDSGFYAVLLSNTCHPSRARRQNRALRRVFHTAVHANWHAHRANAHTGLDRLVWDGFDAVKGKRIAVLTHHAAVDQRGRPLLDVLALEPECIVARVFSPEHGLRGQAEAGEAVGAQRAPVPVTSLYGDRKRPTRDELRGIELFVVDLQDVGARFYTYMATMRECMAACAEARVPMLVLDRPNPIGGGIAEGPLPERVGSLVCAAEVPMRHGMTLGELALLFWRGEFSRPGFEVRVLTVDGWPANLHFDALALPWTPPPPNIPDPKTALLYSGMCLFEGINLNEGRGTDRPFAQVGAPWLDAQAILAGLPAEARIGCELEAVAYTPVAIPGKASNPRHQNEACRGIRITVRDAHALRPVTLALALIVAIQRRHPDELKWLPFFDTLAGGDTLRTRIQAGASALELVADARGAIVNWERNRPARYTDLDAMLRADGLI
jgi:uncharacterized protein YbbC (DUF1343 family)/CubicO group peptidase (beta-lactamase class C family)